ncbi:hypothetical protein [Mesorhizobium xinjiangense]|uniref:hypothetical protein n=1 Tax=Mesorhizobium xinjiangense TaxID=2678685 RepID=UPI0012EDA8D6|nr:hypothetical protein [Mesorhizobium xinjiangense]
MIDYDHNLTAHCNACRHHCRLDLEALGRRLGFEHSTLARALAPKLVCSKCGSKNIALINSDGAADRKKFHAG